MAYHVQFANALKLRPIIESGFCCDLSGEAVNVIRHVPIGECLQSEEAVRTRGMLVHFGLSNLAPLLRSAHQIEHVLC